MLTRNKNVFGDGILFQDDLAAHYFCTPSYLSTICIAMLHSYPD